MARLDRLATVREIAQLGAVLGREFSYEVIRPVAPWDEPTLQHGLAQLVEAELIYRRGLPPRATYLFKHALILDAAYQSSLKSTRQLYHQQIAQVLEARFPETAETEPELLAHHYTQAGFSRQAVSYWQRAGQRAIQHSAYAEAISHLTTALALLRTLPDTPERTRQELDLQITLGPALIPTKGQAAPEGEHAYARARELCRQVGETPQLFPTLIGLWLFYLVRAELQTAHELGAQLLGLAQCQQAPVLLLLAHRVLGTTFLWLGEFTLARAHLEQVMALYDPQQHHFLAFSFGSDLKVHCLSYVALILEWLGYPNQALQKSHEALSLAQDLSHPSGLVVALFFAAWLHYSRREVYVSQERAKAAVTRSAEHGFPFWLAAGTMLGGWALVKQGQGEEGMEQIRQGLATYRATGAEQWRPCSLAVLGEAYREIGQVDEGLQALALVDKNEERWWEAELHRLRGELLLRQAVPNQPQGEACFQKALDVARYQHAKSLELRAAMSLARLWQHRGQRTEARQLLAPIFGWFTEGFDTADLREAKMLPEELS
jgi:predicted ATPase